MSTDHAASSASGGYLGATGEPAAGYDTGSKVAAALLTVFMPMIALIVALAMRSSEMNPVRRAELRSWAIASGAWLAAGLVIGIIAVASVANSVPRVNPSGPCIGGPIFGAAGEPVGHGNYRFECSGGGSTVVHLGN
jgi:hypothetical protein